MNRHQSQAGLSLVELIIGMAVTSLVLSGVVAMVFTLTNSYNTWMGRITGASTGNVLAAAIQADAHRLVACSGSTSELDFCLVDGTMSVAYRTQGSSPYTVTRVIRSGSQVMVRGLTSRPVYHVDCDAAPGDQSGYVEVDGVGGLGALRVHFRSPLGPCREI